MNNKLTFTRYLYNKDEVELTLLECILKKKDFNEIKFWIEELYASIEKEELWQFIFKIYYDFYYVNLPLFLNKLTNYYTKHKKNPQIKYVLFIVYNLSRAYKNIDFNIFLSRTYFSSRLKYIIKNIDLTPYNGSTKYEKLLCYFVSHGKNEFISFYLKKIVNNKNIDTFLFENFNIKIENSNQYNNKFHILLCKLTKFPKIKKKFNFKKVPKRYYNDVEEKKENEIQHYKVLSLKRKYSISDNLGCFELVRSNYILNNEFWYNWEYHAYNCLVWKNRFDKFKIKISKRSKKIEFIDDDELEEFYSNWGYEPDEQSKETQEKSTKKIKSISVLEWIKTFNLNIDNYKIEKKLEY